MQRLSGLVNLRALHVLNFRSGDSCACVSRELHKFIVDNVSQHSGMKLDWLAVKDEVSRLVRITKRYRRLVVDLDTGEVVTPEVDDKSMSGLGSERDPDESESEDDAYHGMKIETTEGLIFSDVEGVKIFRKEVRAGRL